MAVAASLNVNLTATSGQFTSTITNAGKSLNKLSAATRNIASGVKSFLMIETLKKGVNFIRTAVSDIDDLKKSAKGAGVAFSDVEFSKLDKVEALGEKIGGMFDAMKLKLLVGLAPAIDFVYAKFDQLTKFTVGGFSLMEIAGKAVGGVVIIIGKAFQAVYTTIKTGVLGLQVVLKGLIDVAAKAMKLVGQADKAKEFSDMSAVLGKAIDMQWKDVKVDWNEIFSWPDAQKAAATASTAIKAAIQAPTAIGFGSQASTIFDFQKRERQLRSIEKNKQQNPADKQAALIGRTNAILARIEKNTSETPEVFTG